jgi:hypothetical protein
MDEFRFWFRIVRYGGLSIFYKMFSYWMLWLLIQSKPELYPRKPATIQIMALDENWSPVKQVPVSLFLQMDVAAIDFSKVSKHFRILDTFCVLSCAVVTRCGKESNSR